MLKDIHSHNLPSDSGTVIWNACFCVSESLEMQRAEHLSVGIHPWYLTENDFPIQVDWLRSMLEDRRVLAIGEAGLDKLCNTPFDLQEKAFRFQIELSETYHLPLIIHNVKCTAELIKLKRAYKPVSPWIIHGFRGKPQQAADYLRHGFYLSFGEKYSEESLRIVPDNRFLIETDESKVSINDLFLRAASVRNVPLEKLEESVFENINQLFY